MGSTRLPALGPHGEGWFAVQIAIVAAIVAAGSAGPAWSGAARQVSSGAGFVLMALGGLLAIRGVLDLRENLTPFPRPLAGGRLVDTGSYRLVRHPIYGGLIIVATGWSLTTASLPALAATALLLAFFDLKSRREEEWLCEQYKGYAAYRARTRRLLPWLY